MNQAFIKGKKIYLRPIHKSDLATMVNWMNDPDVTYYLFMGERPVLLEQLINEWEKNVNDSNEAAFVIAGKTTNKTIGWCGLYRINWVSRHAEYRIFIGNKHYWNKGVGSEVAKLLTQYAFEKLNLNKVWLGVNASHKGALRSYEKSGFVKEGILRQEIYRNGQYYDAIRMSILRKEYKKNK